MVAALVPSAARQIVTSDSSEPTAFASEGAELPLDPPASRWSYVLMTALAVSAMLLWSIDRYWLPQGVLRWSLSTIVLFTFLITAVVTDLLGRRIRNWTTYPGIAVAVAINLAATTATGLGYTDIVHDWGTIGFGSALLGGCLTFSAMFALFLLFGGGAGDVKLVAMIGTFLGWADGLQIWAAAMVIASLFSIVYIGLRAGWRSLLVPLLTPLLISMGAPHRSAENFATEEARAVFRHRIPLAPFFTCGAIVVLWLKSYGQTLFDLL